MSWAHACLKVFPVGGVLVAAGLWASLAAAETSGGPFAYFAGAWSGAGVLTVSNGGSERIRCRVHYYVAQGDRDLNQQLRCASDSYRFDVNSALLDIGGGRISGSWSETNRKATGRVTGQADVDSVTAHVVGAGFTAELTVALHGDRQSIRIVPTGSDITDVTIELHRE